MKQTKNRKYRSTASTITHDGCQYDINAKKSGIYPQQLHAIIDQLDVCVAMWRRVFVLRIDLHQSHYTETSSMITRFRKNLSRRLERQYGITEIGYTWVREQEKAKHQHYHLAFFLDGDKIRHPATLNKIISDTWQKLKTSNTVHHPVHCYYYINDEQAKAQVVYRLSYLAKARGKGYRTAQAKDYSTSRLIAPKRPTTANISAGKELAA